MGVGMWATEVDGEGGRGGELEAGAHLRGEHGDRDLEAVHGQHGELERSGELARSGGDVGLARAITFDLASLGGDGGEQRAIQRALEHVRQRRGLAIAGVS